jgi:hypothetical protein
LSIIKSLSGFLNFFLKAEPEEEGVCGKIILKEPHVLSCYVIGSKFIPSCVSLSLFLSVWSANSIGCDRSCSQVRKQKKALDLSIHFLLRYSIPERRHGSTGVAGHAFLA